jgi:hypothetical protein
MESLTFWLSAALTLAAGQPSEDAARRERMVALYDELCLKTFPDDGAVDALMAAKGADALTPEEVRVTLRNDPGRGWILQDGDAAIQIMVEMPPFHACSVRWMTDNGFGDLAAYQSATSAYKAARPGFGEPEALQQDVAGFHVTAVNETRPLPDGGAEALLAIEQRVTDPARRANGETRVSVRFVHQIISPDAR